MKKQTGRAGSGVVHGGGCRCVMVVARAGAGPGAASQSAPRPSAIQRFQPLGGAPGGGRLSRPFRRAIPGVRQCPPRPGRWLSPRSASSSANMVQFSVDYDDGTQHSDIGDIASAMQALASRAKDGCLIYFTSHGTPDGIVIGDARAGARPDAGRWWATPAATAQRDRDVGLLFRPVRGAADGRQPHRPDGGAARPHQLRLRRDGSLHLLRRLFPALAGRWRATFPAWASWCSAASPSANSEMKATPPSEPQISVGPQMVFTTKWRDVPQPASPPPSEFPSK